MSMLWQALRALALFTLITGVIYPVITTVLADLLFPKQAAGSLVARGGRLVGSELLAQKFKSPRYFWPRPSAGDYATVASSASNKGPTSADLAKFIAGQREKFGDDAPADLLTTSGSGLDPHISAAAATLQVARVAAARKLPAQKLAALVEAHVEPPQLGVFGEPRVNVFALNLALDHLR